MVERERERRKESERERVRAERERESKEKTCFGRGGLEWQKEEHTGVVGGGLWDGVWGCGEETGAERTVASTRKHAVCL